MKDLRNFGSFMRCIQHRITGGSAHLWTCYPGGWHYECDNDKAGLTLIANCDAGVVYEANIIPNSTGAAYRWINPDYVLAFREESARLDLDWEEALQGEKWVDVQNFDEFLAKAAQIRDDLLPPQVDVDLTLDDDVVLSLALAAHEKGITLNEHITDVMRAIVDLRETDAAA